MPKYRKKPVVVEAVQYDGTEKSLLEIMRLQERSVKRVFVDNSGELRIPTLEGTLRANKGDYIIKGVKGELYPCKPDIFKQTYEPVEE